MKAINWKSITKGQQKRGLGIVKLEAYLNNNVSEQLLTVFVYVHSSLSLLDYF